MRVPDSSWPGADSNEKEPWRAPVVRAPVR
jgi:hypothetical protein